MRTGDVAGNSAPGTMQAASEVFLSHANARANEALCLLKADSLDLETLMSVSQSYSAIALFHRREGPFSSRTARMSVATLLFRV